MSAADWLTAHLERCQGRSKATHVLQAAEAAGYTRDQIKRAKAKAGVVSKHPSMNGPWFWELPATERAPTRSQPSCRGCGRPRTLDGGYCSTCSQALARRPESRSRPKDWRVWS